MECMLPLSARLLRNYFRIQQDEPAFLRHAVNFRQHLAPFFFFVEHVSGYRSVIRNTEQSGTVKATPADHIPCAQRVPLPRRHPVAGDRKRQRYEA
jgi:hypothetical protein